MLLCFAAAAEISSITEPPLLTITPQSGIDAVPVIGASGLCGVIILFRKNGNQSFSIPLHLTTVRAHPNPAASYRVCRKIATGSHAMPAIFVVLICVRNMAS
ncbi:MAG: hypothetical protein ABSG06_00855 [Methanoregula sp.]